MNVKMLPLGVLAVLMISCGPVFGATVLIDPTHNNGSFEYADGVLSTAKIGFDVTPDIDNWTQWTEVSPTAKNSGVENISSHASDGVMIAYLEHPDAIKNMTTWIAQEGDTFDFSWDHVQRDSRAHRVGLVYDDGGTFTSIAASEVYSTDPSPAIPFTYTGSFTVAAGSPVIGHAIGLGLFASDSEGGGYPEVDNFILTVTPVPEPTSIVLMGLALVGLVAVRRSRG